MQRHRISPVNSDSPSETSHTFYGYFFAVEEEVILWTICSHNVVWIFFSMLNKTDLSKSDMKAQKYNKTLLRTTQLKGVLEISSMFKKILFPSTHKTTRILF